MLIAASNINLRMFELWMFFQKLAVLHVALWMGNSSEIARSGKISVVIPVEIADRRSNTMGGWIECFGSEETNWCSTPILGFEDIPSFAASIYLEKRPTLLAFPVEAEHGPQWTMWNIPNCMVPGIVWANTSHKIKHHPKLFLMNFPETNSKDWNQFLKEDQQKTLGEKNSKPCRKKLHLGL